MLIANTPIPEVEQMVSRPVIVAVIEQIKDITNIPSDTIITYVGQNNSRIPFTTSTNPNEAPVVLGSDRMITVEVDEEPDEAMFATTPGNRIDNTPDFLDRALGVTLKPIYTGMNMVTTVTFRTPSRTEAVRWRNDARYKASQMRSVNLHVVEYAYQLPKAAIVLLKHIWELREKQFGFGQSFEDYMSEHFTTRATVATTIVGTQSEYLIREAQDRVQGTFDFTYNPRKQEKTDGDVWEVSFTYTFSYQKPTEYSMIYPLLVHQQPIKYEYIPMLPMDPYEAKSRRSLSVTAFHFFEAPVVLERLTGRVPIHYSPQQDLWTPDQPPASRRIVASFMVYVKPELKRQKLLNLNQLGNYYINPDVLEWMVKSEYKYLTIPSTSPVTISLYRNECLAFPKDLEVDNEGNVWLIGEADCRKRYRVTISVATTLTSCSPASIKRCALFPKAMCKIIKLTRTTTGTLYSLLAYVNLLKFADCASEGGVSLQKAIDSIVTRKTVMIAGVEAHNLVNYPKKEG